MLMVAKVLRLPLAVHTALSVANMMVLAFFLDQFNTYYALSLHPVDFWVEQLSFNADGIKWHFAYMEAKGTLDFYWKAQIVDYAYIASVACAGVTTCTLPMRFSAISSFPYRLGLFSACLTITSAGCDAVENLWAFVMLTNPADFSAWLVWPYSGFASLKFLISGAAVLCLLLSVAGTFCQGDN